MVCTLFEGDFYLGVGALINSIVQNGFRGLFWVGYRGNLPRWVTDLARDEHGLYVVGEARISFEELPNARHFGQYKAEFMSSLFDRGIARRQLWYFDPDITVRCDWSFYERWLRFGICLCHDMRPNMISGSHPLRLEWIDLARKAGWGEPLRVPDRYYNSGFLGVRLENRSILRNWIKAIDLANAEGVRRDQFQQGTRAQTFYTVDQDTLNFAAMYAVAPFSTIGVEGMGWASGGFTMYHSVGHYKPWRKAFVRSAIFGYPPSNGDKHFLSNADGLIRIYATAWELRRRRMGARAGAFLGRFYHRQ